MGIRVLMVTNSYPTTNHPEMGYAVFNQESGLRELGIDVKILFLDRLRFGRSVYINARKKIRQAADVYSPDIIHIQFGGIHALQGTWVGEKPTIITFHGTDLHGGCPRGILEHMAFAICRQASVWAARRAAWNIVVSRNLGNHLAGISSCVEVIPTGVDFKRFCPMEREYALRQLGLDGTRHYCLFCDSQLAGAKRRYLAELAINHVRRIIPRAQLLELHGVPHTSVPSYLNASDLLLVTSEKEGSPNIVKEAIACNTPIVSVDVGDVAEQLSGVMNCRLVDREPSAIASAMVEIISRGQRANGRDAAISTIGNAAICARIAQVYHRVLGIPINCA